MKKRKFVIVGGGTAGWITAHRIRQLFPDDEVTIIYSEEKGIIGVGEATTPHLTEFINSLGIDVFHFLKEVGGTIKNGIKFKNWNGDGKEYMHPFVDRISEFSIPNVFDQECWTYYQQLLINKNLPFNQYLYQPRLADENKIDLYNTSFAIHFDANKFAKYLEVIAADKNIEIIVGDVVSTDLKENGNIEKINLKEQTIECDFVFDCSGFSKLLIGKLFKEEWISYKQYLPMKKAITFWLDADEKIPSYTAATAMKYGWSWKIPLRDRFGCGYVYDSDYINEHEAQQEAEEYYQRKLDVRKVIDFDAGRYKNVWVKNCIAVGLSGNFIEPLESTSIWLELSLFDVLKRFLNEIDNPNENSIALFNQIVGNEVDEKMSFVYLHYMTKRNDSPFWKEFREKNIMPDELKKIWPVIKENNLRQYHVSDTLCPSHFPLMSYLWVCEGLGLFENRGNVAGYENIEPHPEIYRAIIDEYINHVAKDHTEFLLEP